MDDAVPMKVDEVNLKWLHAPAVYLNMDAVPMQWMQCPTKWMQYVVTKDAVPTNMDAVSLQ